MDMYLTKSEFFDIRIRNDFLRKIDKAKERFMAGEEMEYIPDQAIIESWRRCKEQDIPIEQHIAPVALSKEQIEGKYGQKSWITLAIETMHEFNHIPDHIVLLSDISGHVLWSKGDKQTIQKAQNMNLIPGGNWSETETGTNAIAMSILIDKPIQIIGTEHFCKGWQCWVCSASPIYDPVTKDVLGVVNITGFIEQSSPHLINLSVAIAKAIETKLLKQKFIHQSKLLDEYHSALNKWGESSNGILVIENNGEILQYNSKAQRTLHNIGHDLMRSPQKQIPNAFLNGGKRNGIHPLQLPDHIELTVQTINYENREIGSILFLSEKKTSLFNVHKPIGSKDAFDQIITDNQQLKDMIQKTRQLAPYDINILIEGESGTGKELFVKSIHSESSRANGPLVSVNCGAIPKELIASELFGYEEGSFTGASKGGKKGKFELANNGTIFLDEIGEMPLELQVYLLRVLQEKEIFRVGGKNAVPVNVRVIAATNKNLQKHVEMGIFREDLYYRINSAKIHVPPLRNRKDDIPHLISFFLQSFHKDRDGLLAPLHQQVVDILQHYDWPGNVRQLRNIVEYMSVLSGGDEITIDHLPEFLQELSTETHFTQHRLLEPFTTDTHDVIRNALEDQKAEDLEEKEMIEQLLRLHRGNLSAVARAMKISRPTLYKKIKQLNVSVTKQY